MTVRRRANEMRLWIPALAVLVAVYVWDRNYNNGRLWIARSGSTLAGLVGTARRALTWSWSRNCFFSGSVFASAITIAITINSNTVEIPEKNAEGALGGLILGYHGARTRSDVSSSARGQVGCRKLFCMRQEAHLRGVKLE